MSNTFTREEVEKIIIRVKDYFGGSELYDYTSDEEVLEWFNKTYPNLVYDACVLCGKISPYTTETHIDNRIGYIEGAGQGCFNPKNCNKNF